MAVDQRSFSDLAADAVAHLYDLPYLQTHPLSELVAGSRSQRRSAELRGSALHHALLEAIKALKPATNAPGTAHAWRIYRYLFLRFVQAASPQEVARGLAISDRQSRRVYREAIDALASVLLDRYGSPRPASLARPADDHPPSRDSHDGAQPAPGLLASESGPAYRSLLDQEVQHLAARGQGSSSDLAEVIEGLRSIVDPLGRQHGSALVVSLLPSHLRIAADRTIVRQILLNLLVALLEWRPGQLHLSAQLASGSVRVVLESRPDPGWESGADRLAEAIEARLAVSRRLVEAEGGALSIEPSSKGIARVAVSLPATPQGSVLVIDDNRDVVTVFRRYLEPTGFEVIAAESGDEGFRLAKELRPQAITLDVMMASRDGWETLQLLKNDPATQDIPVLVCSVLREESLARFLGAAGLLPKPVTRTELLAALARCGLTLPAEERQSSL